MMKVTQRTFAGETAAQPPEEKRPERGLPQWWEKIDWVRLLVSLTIPLAAGGIMGALIGQKTGEVYASFLKPPLSPPEWVFLPVWTALYGLMGIALYLAVTSDETERGRTRACIFFGVQLALNLLWPVVFFLLEQPGWAVVVILALMIAIAVTMDCFSKRSQAAARLLIPYLIWTAFAAYLNISIALLN